MVGLEAFVGSHRVVGLVLRKFWIIVDMVVY